MRISDWSSDVCSSDLDAPIPVRPDGKGAIRATDTYSPGWSEAGIICGYEMYRTYGDTRIVKQSLPYMKEFMGFRRQKAGSDRIFKENRFDEVSTKGGCGDWLSIGKKTSPDQHATVYYEYCDQVRAEGVEEIGRE